MNFHSRAEQASLPASTRQAGGIIIQVLVFATVSIVILSGFVGWGAMSVRVARHSEAREQALQIAEAGIDYYRWHLAHAPSDFQDGTGTPGSYVHDYADKNGVKIGTFTLTVTAPTLGSTLVTIKSTGQVLSDETVTRTIETRLAKPSFAKYAAISNVGVQFGSGTEFFGPVHSNGGLNFFGTAAHNLMTSAANTWLNFYNGVTTYGVYTTGDALPNASFPTANPIFQAGRQKGVPTVDFSGMAADLAQMKLDANANGKYYAPSASGFGYHIVLKTNDTFDMYQVNTLSTNPGGCIARQPFNACAISAIPPSLWSIGTEALIAGGGNVPLPANGIIFVEDHVWVDGQIDTARITIASAKFPDNPSTRTNIVVNNNLLYTNYNGQDTLALIAQNDIILGLKSADNQRIDAALIAQSGRLHRLHYNTSCGTWRLRNSVVFYGMFASAQRYMLYTGCGTVASGYVNRTFTYDPNLLYAPPPSFPLTTSQYQVLSWDEK